MDSRLDFFSPTFVLALIMAFARDFSLLFAIGLAIPIVGQVLAAFIGAAYLISAIAVFVILFPKIHGLLARGALILGAVLPIPFSMITGIIIAVVLQNRLIKFAAEQAVLAAATGGVGNIAEGTAIAGKAAAGARGAARTRSVGSAAAEAGGVAEAGAKSAAGKAAEAVTAQEEKFFGMPKETLKEIKEKYLESFPEIPPAAPEPEEESAEELRRRGALGEAELKELKEGLGEKRLEQISEVPPEKQSSGEVDIDDKNNEINLKKKP